MTKTCPDRKHRKNLCPTCNPAGGLLDRPAAALRRARNTATGRRTTVSNDGGRKTVTTRAGWLAPTVTKTSGKPKAAAKRKPAARTTPKPAPSTVSCIHGVPLNRHCKDC